MYEFGLGRCGWRGLCLGFTNPAGTGGVGRGLEPESGGVVLCLWESGLSVYMAGPGICVLLLADTCASEVHPVFNPVAPYGYLLPNMYVFMAVPAIQRVRMAGLPKNGKSGPHCWGREGLTQLAQQFVTAVTAPPLVGCVIWSLPYGHLLHPRPALTNCKSCRMHH